MYKIISSEASSFWHNPYEIDKSFSSFQKLPLFLKFAQSGFYFIQSKNVIRCFSCNLEIKQWQDIKNPLIIHALESPSCEFLRTELSEVEIFDIQKNYIIDYTAETFLCKICYERTVDQFLICKSHQTRIEDCPTCRYFIFDNEQGELGFDCENP